MHVGTLLCSSCICVSSTDSKWMSVIITFLLFLTLVGIPLAIAIIYKRKKKGLIIALFLYGSNLFCDYIDVSIYRGENCIPAPAAMFTILHLISEFKEGKPTHWLFSCGCLKKNSYLAFVSCVCHFCSMFQHHDTIHC